MNELNNWRLFLVWGGKSARAIRVRAFSLSLWINWY